MELGIDRYVRAQDLAGYRNGLRHKGYEVLIVAVVRNADAPEFWSDVLRYWSSLHDLTGKSIAFAISAPKLANQARDLQFLDSSTRASPPADLDFRAGFGEQDWCTRLPEPSLAVGLADPTWRTAFLDANTAQVSDLRDQLGLSEQNLPCLHLSTTAGPQVSTFIELNARRQSSVYLLCKEIVVELQPALNAILEKKAELQDIESASHRELAEASGRIPSFPRPAPKAQLLLRRARELTLAIGSPKIPALLVEEFPKRAWKSEARQQALADLEQYRREAGEAEAQRLCTLLGRLVMTWSDGGYVPFDPESENSYSGGAIEALRKMRADLKAGRERLEVEISRRRGELADRMVALGRTAPDAGEGQWDFFLSYASPDRELVDPIYHSLSSGSGVFMDKYCLRPGDRWQLRLASAQERRGPRYRS